VPAPNQDRKKSPQSAVDQSAVENNGEQRTLGGITGRGFMPGQSGNPGGRPRTHGLLEVLRTAVDETVAKSLVEVLLAEALKGRHPLPAISTIFDRLEGRPKTQIDFNDITKAMSNRSADDLVFYAEHESTAEAEASEGDEQHES
jgi:hypothetical protein